MVWSLGALPSIRYRLGGFLERAIPEPSSDVVPAALLCAYAAARGRAARRGRPRRPCARRHPDLQADRRGLLADACGCSAGAARTNAILRAASSSAWRGSCASAYVALALAGGRRRGCTGGDHRLQPRLVRAGLGTDPIALVDAFAHDVWRRTKTDPLWMSGMLAAAWCLETWRSRSADALSRASSRGALVSRLLGRSPAASDSTTPTSFRVFPPLPAGTA